MHCNAVPFLRIYFEACSCTLRNIPEHQSRRAKCIPGVSASILPCQTPSEGWIQSAVVAGAGSWGKPRSGCVGE